MEPIDFNMIVMPMALLIVGLLVLVFFYATRRERADKQLEELGDQMRLGIIDKKTFERQARNLEADRIYNRELEELRTLYKQKKIDKDIYLRLWQTLAYSKMTAVGYMHTHTSPDGTIMYFAPARVFYLNEEPQSANAS